jgi:hypothetical protein
MMEEMDIDKSRGEIKASVDELLETTTYVT